MMGTGGGCCWSGEHREKKKKKHTRMTYCMLLAARVNVFFHGNVWVLAFDRLDPGLAQGALEHLDILYRSPQTDAGREGVRE